MMSIFHLNSCSPLKNIDDLEHLIRPTKTDFDIITVSEYLKNKNNNQE